MNGECEHMKMGIMIGSVFGMTDFRTDVKDPKKAVEEANIYFREKFGGAFYLIIRKRRSPRSKRKLRSQQ